MSKEISEACYIGPRISPEQVIQEHSFLYIIEGVIYGFDGSKTYCLAAGECCILCKNHLVRYSKEKINGQFERIAIIFDEDFLMSFQNKYQLSPIRFKAKAPFLAVHKNQLILNFIQSLKPYYSCMGSLEATYADIKREELLVILLQNQPELIDVLFDFGQPEKIDLELFFNKSYKFNVSISRFAYLTGRSLSAFKRDFKATFKDTPHRWLVQKRLQEAYFLLSYKNRKPSEIYLEVGFEDFSHFSYAFKKRFGLKPTEVAQQRSKLSST